MLKNSHQVAQIITWIKADLERYQILQIAADLNLKEWCLGAGFVRNLVWDHIHKKQRLTPLNDIDLIYFDRSDLSETIDLEHEKYLKSLIDLPWSVKNQVRMHIRNNDLAYQSTLDAMSYWPEIETAVGTSLLDNGELSIIAPFGVSKLFENTITYNQKSNKPAAFAERIARKQWLENWTELQLLQP